jgi:hypothetical protein
MPAQVPLRPAPWWLWEDETCEHCGGCAQPYALEIAYFCVDCDHPVCPICAVIVRESGAALCPECFQSSQAG